MNRTILRAGLVGALLLSTACEEGVLSEGMLPGDCDDGADNDGDGTFDCNDPGCAAAPACTDSDTDVDTDTDSDTDADSDTDRDTDTDADTEPDTDPDTDDDTGRDPIDPAPHTCFDVPTGRCPDGTPTLGRAGEHQLQYANLTWQYSSRCGVSYTSPIYVKRPSDLRSVALTVDAGSRLTGLGFVAMDGHAILDVEVESAPIGWETDPFKHRWNTAGSIVLPNAPSSRPPAGDCLSIVPLAYGDARGSTGTLYLSSRRESAGRTLDFNFVVVGGTDIETSELSSAVASLRTHLAGTGLSVGDVYRWDLSTRWGRYLPGISSAETLSLRAVELEDATEQAINVFFVQDVTGASVYGFAGGAPGPVGIPGTPASGVIVSVDSHLYSDFTTLNTDQLGATIAHEAGHQLGMFHLTEADGRAFDPLSDTPQCPRSRDRDGDGQLLPSECSGYGADHVMFWTTDGRTQQAWSSQQADVLRRSPAVRP